MAEQREGEQHLTVVEELFRRTVRAFFEDEVVVVADLLVREQVKNALTEEDISKILMLNKQVVNRVLAQMKENKLAKSVTKAEIDPETGKQKNFKAAMANRHYYYIDYREFLDVVRYKERMMRDKLEAGNISENEMAKYVCQVCKKEYSQYDMSAVTMQMMNNGDMGEPKCIEDDCGGELEEEKVEREMQDGAVRIARFNEAFREIQTLLGQLNNIEIPSSRPNFTKLGQVEPDAALERKVEQENPEEADRMDLGGANEIVVEIQSDEATDNAKSKYKDAEEAKAVPIWFTTSTVEKVNYDPVVIREDRNDEEEEEEKEVVPKISLEELAARYEKDAGGSSTLGKRGREDDAIVLDDDSNEGKEEAEGDDDDDDDDGEMVMVAGVPKKLGEVTEEDQENMSPDEFQAFHSALEALQDF